MCFITIKSFKAAAIAIIYAQVAFPAPADVVSAQEDANNECGSLRVIKVNNATLLANIDRNDIRKCGGHPVDSEKDRVGNSYFRATTGTRTTTDAARADTAGQDVASTDVWGAVIEGLSRISIRVAGLYRELKDAGLNW